VKRTYILNLKTEEHGDVLEDIYSYLKEYQEGGKVLLKLDRWESHIDNKLIVELYSFLGIGLTRFEFWLEWSLINYRIGVDR
jgi:hypothetical protein